MPLNQDARKKARDFVESTLGEMAPNIRVEPGSPVHSLLVLPFALTYAALFNEIDALRQRHLGNYAQLSTQDMNRLGKNFLVERPSGSRARVTVKVFLESPVPFSLDVTPYFSTRNGDVSFRPIEPMTFEINDLLSEEGEYFVRVPCMATTTGPVGRVSAGTITDFNDLPIDVSRVNNPEPSRGGDRQATNEEYFQLIQDAQNSSLAQEGGLRQRILSDFPPVRDISIVKAGDPSMRRDEVWEASDPPPSFGTPIDDTSTRTPNFKRRGQPLAEHTIVRDVSFHEKQGRMYKKGAFKDIEPGQRFMVDDDVHVYRLIVQVLNDDEALFSGPPLEQARDIKILHEGPHTLGKADIYVDTPSLQVKSTIIDQSIYLEVDQQTSAGEKVVSVSLSSASQKSVQKGVAVVNEGANNERVMQVKAFDGDAITLDAPLDQPLQEGQKVRLYDMDMFESQDVFETPVAYILRMDVMDPSGQSPVREVEHTTPAPFDAPGWYWEHQDPATLYSTREQKRLRLDAKKSVFQRVDQNNLKVKEAKRKKESPDNTLLDQDGYRVQKRGHTYDPTLRGRRVRMTRPSHSKTIQFPNSGTSSFSLTDASGTGIQSNDIDVPYFTKKGYQEGLSLKARIDGPNGIEDIIWDDVLGWGHTLEREGDKTFLEHPSLDNSIISILELRALSSSGLPSREVTQEGVIVNTPSGDTIDINTPGFVDLVSTSDGIQSSLDISILTPDQQFQHAPIRVIYASHNVVRNIQDTLDESGDVLVNDDLLVKMPRPSLIDTSITYRGSTSPATLRERFRTLVRQAGQDADDKRLQINLSSVIARLNEEGYVDWIELSPEIRVTNILRDGSREVKYLSPEPPTKQTMALTEATSIGATTLEAAQEDALPMPQGRLFLGGLDPDQQEVVPYEAVVEHDDTFEFVLRDGWTLQQPHNEYEPVTVTAQDYDPELEFDGQTLYIPQQNRPYLRHLDIQKRSS